MKIMNMFYLSATTVLVFLYFQFDFMNSDKGTWFWYLSYIVLSPQCLALTLLSLFNQMSPRNAMSQCVAFGLTRLEFSYRRDWFGPAGTTLFWTAVWIFGWGYLKQRLR